MTGAQQKVWDAMRFLELENDEPPTIREICDATGLKSKATVFAHLKLMERAGTVSRTRRGFYVTAGEAT